MWQRRLLSFHFLLNTALELYFDVDLTKLALHFSFWCIGLLKKKEKRENEEIVRTIAALKNKKSAEALGLESLL